jgi:hypothetical protein
MITNYLGFEYGYPEHGKSYYGLWSPALNCFIFVHGDIQRLTKLQWLLSSKIVVNILEFDNTVLEQNLIDNTCCENWTVVQDGQINIALSYKQGGTVTSCQHTLVKNQNPVFEQDITFLREWSFLLNHWCNKIESELNTKNPLERYVLSMINAEQTEKTKQMNQLYLQLWLGDSIQDTSNTLKTILDEKNFSN